MYTPGTRVGQGFRYRTLAVKSRKNVQKSVFFCKKIEITFFLHISSSYAKILGETNFHAREIPRSGSKVEGGEKKKNTPGTRGWSRLRDRMPVVHKKCAKISFFS